MQENAVQEYEGKGLAWFKGLGRIDQVGLACLTFAGVLIAIALLSKAIAYLVSYIPFLPYVVYAFFRELTALASWAVWPIIIGGGLVLFGGPRRRRAVFFFPRMLWEAIQIFRLDRAAYARRRNNRARREQEKADSHVADIRRRIEAGMPQHEFEALLIEVEEELEAEGQAAHEIEVILSNLEDLREESQQRRELVERRREARARRRAGLADPDEDETDAADREMLARMQQNVAAESRREVEAQERARQESYEDALAHEEEEMRREERRARTEERRERNRNR